MENDSHASGANGEVVQAAGASEPEPPLESSASAEVLRVILQLAEGGVLRVSALMTAAGGAQRAA